MTARRLAIAIDAAEPSLIRRLAERGELPTISKLADGRWSRVDSPAAIGSGTVWPTFISGRSPRDHGICSEWQWDAFAMSLRRTDVDGIDPFWSRIPGAVALFDLPFAPFGRVGKGFEVSEWGAHDRIVGTMRMSAGVGELPAHPFTAEAGRVVSDEELVSQCVRGAALRGEVIARLLRDRDAGLAIVAFSELHHAAHRLWGKDDALARVARAIDGAIAAIVESASPASTVIFSLHGMREASGVAALLDDVLVAQGLAARAGWRSQTWRQRARSLFAQAKRAAPAGIKRLYYRVTPPSTTHALARTTMLPQHDWRRTRAFALPSDQNGWIRINRAGREAAGIVGDAEVDALFDRIESVLGGLRSAGGERLVHDVIRTSPSRGSSLPDLVVHWTRAAEVPPFGVQPPSGPQNGQHAPDGFAAGDGLQLPDALAVEELHTIVCAPDHAAPAR